ncbi:MAG: hypothetical protein ABR548_13770 [Actinomycetota bacterium]
MITIRMENQEPPVGFSEAPGIEPVRFEGWLGMMKVLADLVAAAESVSPDAVGWPDLSASRFDVQGAPSFDERVEHIG